MATEDRTSATPKFPLRLMPSLRRTAETVSRREGVSLNQFINLAVAEKLAHLELEDWVRNRKPATEDLAARALSLVDKAAGRPVAPGDELPGDLQRKRG